MAFLKGFLRNLALIVGLGVVIYLIEPEMVKSVIEAYWMILGPIAVLFLIIAALPKKTRKEVD